MYLYLHNQGFQASLDTSQGSINKKVRNAQLAQWNYILVAGEEEMNTGTVDVRMREDSARHGKWRIDDLAAHLHTMVPKLSDSHVNFYKNMWNPANYPKDGAASAKVKDEHHCHDFDAIEVFLSNEKR